MINVTTKSGTNEFHADFWTYLQRPGWNANSFQNNAIGAQRTKQRQNQWGLQVAGPLAGLKIIPNNEKFKVFYLFAFDKYHTELPNPLNLSYPAMEMRNGDFSKLVNAAGGRSPSLIRRQAARMPRATSFANRSRAMPFQAIASIRSRRLLAQSMPTPDTNTPGVRYATQNVRRPNNLHYWEFFNWMARMDFNIGSKNRVFVRPARMLFDEKSLYNAVEGPGKNGGVFSRSNYALLVDWVSTISPTLVANLRVNASQYGEGWNSAENKGYDLTKLGYRKRFSARYQILRCSDDGNGPAIPDWANRKTGTTPTPIACKAAFRSSSVNTACAAASTCGRRITSITRLPTRSISNRTRATHAVHGTWLQRRRTAVTASRRSCWGRLLPAMSTIVFVPGSILVCRTLVPG